MYSLVSVESYIRNIHKYKKCSEHRIDWEELTAIAAETRLRLLRKAPMTAIIEKCILMEKGVRILVSNLWMAVEMDYYRVSVRIELLGQSELKKRGL